MKNLFSVAGKTALVTGGATGIGRMISEGLVANGVKVYIAGRRQDVLEETATALSAYGTCIALPGDVSSMEGIEALANDLAAQETGLDILVNNAGVVSVGSFGRFKERGWDKVMDINAKAPFFLAQALLPLLQANADAQDPSRIINIGSIDGTRTPFFDTYAYSISKAAVHQMTTVMAGKLTASHITVNGIQPGSFPSEMMEDTLNQAGEMILKNIPRGRIGSAEDIAGTVIYLASRAGAFTSGALIKVDGAETSFNGI